MRVFAFDNDPYLSSLATTAVESGADKSGSWVVAEDTIFYPEGGGQPSDGGTINGVEVLHVERVADRILHRLTGPVEAADLDMVLDWPRRWDHMQQHSAQHLLTAIAADAFGWPTTAFHLGAEVSDIELGASDLGPSDLARLEERAGAEIARSRRISAQRVDREEYDSLAVRTRGLPEGHTGTIRLVEIEGMDLNTCGGTHLRSTAEIGALCLLGTEKLRGGTRVFFVAGDRVRRRMRAHEDTLRRLRQSLDAPDEGLVSEADRRVRHIKDQARTIKKLTADLAASEVVRLVGSAARCVSRHWPDRTMPFLQTVGRGLAEAEPKIAALLTAGEGDIAFVVVAGSRSGIDLSVLGPKVASLLGGRGGGGGVVYQGKGRLDGRAEALALIEREIGPDSG